MKTASYSQHGICIDSIQHGGFTQVANVDFGDGEAVALSVMAKANRTPANIQVFIDNMYDNSPIATIDVSEKTFTEYQTALTSVPAGTHDLYFLFTSSTDVHKNLMAVDYWQFHKGDETPVTSPARQSETSDTYYTLGGIPVTHPVSPGIYIQKGRKVRR